MCSLYVDRHSDKASYAEIVMEALWTGTSYVSYVDRHSYRQFCGDTRLVSIYGVTLSVRHA